MKPCFYGPNRNVVLIVGPPGAGKSTRAIQLGLPHFEREQYNTDDEYKQAVETHCANPDAQAAIVRTCISSAEQREWERVTQATTVEVLDTPYTECARRIKARANPTWTQELYGAKRWHKVRATERFFTNMRT